MFQEWFIICPRESKRDWVRKSFFLMIGDTGGKYFPAEILIWYILWSFKSGLRGISVGEKKSGLIWDRKGSVAENRDEKRQKILSLSISRKILEEYYITILDFWIVVVFGMLICLCFVWCTRKCRSALSDLANELDRITLLIDIKNILAIKKPRLSRHYIRSQYTAVYIDRFFNIFMNLIINLVKILYLNLF